MKSSERKKVTIIAKYVEDSFSEGDWYTLGQITGKLHDISNHPRLFRAMRFGDEDYQYCAAEVLNTIFNSDQSLIDEVIDHFDIDLWYQQKDPEKARRVFSTNQPITADFWSDGQIRLFVSHLSVNKEKMSAMKAELAKWVFPLLLPMKILSQLGNG